MTDLDLYTRVAFFDKYHQTPNVNRTVLAGNKIADHSDVVGASLLQLHLHSQPSTWFQWIGPHTIARRDEHHLNFWDLVRLILEIL